MLTIHDTIQYEPGSSHLCSEGTQSVLSTLLTFSCAIQRVRKAKTTRSSDGFNTFLFLSRFVGFNIIIGTVLRDTISIIKRISKTVPVISSVIFILRSSGGKERLLLIVPTALFFLGSQPVVIVGDFFGRRITHRTAHQDVCLMLQHYDHAGRFLVCSLFH